MPSTVLLKKGCLGSISRTTNDPREQCHIFLENPLVLEDVLGAGSKRSGRLYNW